MYKEVEESVNSRLPKSTLARTIIFTFSFATVFLLGLYIGNGKIPIGNSVNLSKNQSNAKLPSKLDFNSTQELYDALKKGYDGDIDQAKLMDGIKKGLVASTGDPYTEYFNDAEAKDFNSSLNGTFSGIGAELSKTKDSIEIIAPISGYPAEKAGLKPKDVIVKINDESALEFSVTEAVNKIRGPEGSKVKLKIVRGGTKELDFEITRTKITIPSVEYSVDENHIGYMKISRYGEDTAGLAKKAAQEFKDKGATKVILDVRSDPGGLLDAAVEVSSLWIDKGKTVLDEKRGGEVVKSYKASGNNILKGMPTVVLINEGSASASEITAGALKDNGVATLIGVKSFGKGSVQQLSELPSGGVLKVTIARWYTPAGKNINKEGIEPDQKVELTEENAKNKQDPQKDAAIEFLKMK